MDLEFHYYITYLIAAKAGFDPEKALIIAYSSQYVDDNDKIFRIKNKISDNFYQNYISQTMNITMPQVKLKRIYPLFHFIPGDYEEQSEKLIVEPPKLITTPDSQNANQIINLALSSKNLYRIGIACHSYTDTWAHQNFVGASNEFNSFNNWDDQIIPNIGHADVGHKPDRLNLIWHDYRLKSPQVNNQTRFLAAAESIFRKLKLCLDPKLSKEILKLEVNDLINDLKKVIIKNQIREERIKAYQKLAKQEKYGNQKLPKYNKDLWFNQAIKEELPQLEIDLFFKKIYPLEDFNNYHWRDDKSYKTTNWYQFQEAIKKHQEVAELVLKEVLNK